MRLAAQSNEDSDSDEDSATSASINEFYTNDIADYTNMYKLETHGCTIVNILLCLFDILEAVTVRPPVVPLRRGAPKVRRFYASPQCTKDPYQRRDGDLCVRDGFDLEHNEKLDSSVAGILSSIQNVKVIQFFIMTRFCDNVSKNSEN